MKHVLDTSEILGTVSMPQGQRELFAAGNAIYDEEAGRLQVTLDAFLRSADLHRTENISADWLPKKETVSESVGPEETMDLAKEIFHRWVRKVRESAPSLHS